MIKVNLITDWSKDNKTVQKEVELPIVPRKGDNIKILEWFDESEFPDCCDDCLVLFEVDYLVIRKTRIDVFVMAIDTENFTLAEQRMNSIE